MKQNKHQGGTTNSLEKAGLTTSSSYTASLQEIINKSPSNTKQTTDRDKEIEDLRNKIKFLKQNQRQHDTQDQAKHIENKKEHPKPKNIQVVSPSGGHTQRNIDPLKVLNLVQKAMQILSNYREQLQTHLDINLTHQVIL